MLEKFSEPMWAEMDDHLTGTYLDPLDQGEKGDPLPQRRYPSQIGGALVRTHDEVLLQSLAGLSVNDLEQARWLRKQPTNLVHDDMLDLRSRNAQPDGEIGPNIDNQQAGDVIAVALAVLDRMGGVMRWPSRR
jgi:hypothetical protein